MTTIFAICTAAAVMVLALLPTASAHWPDQAPHHIADLGEFRFEGGGAIQNLKMSYVTHGKLNAAKDNAILFQHGFAANHHLFDHMIGPGKPLDTDKYFIICPDALGATQTTFEHSTSPTSSGTPARRIYRPKSPAGLTASTRSKRPNDTASDQEGP